jgi:hypothetical protein
MRTGRPTHTIRLSVTLIAAGLAVSCSDQGLPTPPGAQFAQVANQENARGAIIVRLENRFLIIAFDFEKELLATHGFNEGGFLFCGDPLTVIHLADVQRLLNPAEQELIMELFKVDDAFIRVYDWTGMPPIGPTICQGEVLATGSGRLVITDNDLLALVEHNRTNAFGFTAEGALNDAASGSRLHYNAVQRFTLDRDESGETLREHRTISLRPVGGE